MVRVPPILFIKLLDSFGVPGNVYYLTAVGIIADQYGMEAILDHVGLPPILFVSLLRKRRFLCLDFAAQLQPPILASRARV